MRLSIPGPARTVASQVEPRALHVRAAVAELARALGPAAGGVFDQILAPRWGVAGIKADQGACEQRAAWALVEMWLVGRLTGALDPSSRLGDAEAWFLGDHAAVFPSLRGHVDDVAARRAEEHLARLPVDGDLLELLPYVLEPHGPGTRLSVMKD